MNKLFYLQVFYIIYGFWLLFSAIFIIFALPMIKEYAIRVMPHFAATNEQLKDYVARENGIDARTITALRVVRKSIDARHSPVYVNLMVKAYIGEEAPREEFRRTVYNDVSGKPRVVVVGEGPAGLFAALRLIEIGCCPVVVERGKDVRERKTDLARITKEQKVDPQSNYCFGEGGAGAYSDGKLFTRSKKRGSVEKILSVLCQHGASTDILSDAHPHIGTDKLPKVVENIRTTIENCGGEVHHQTLMKRLIVEDDEVRGIEAEDLHDGRGRNFRGPVILATGHSARDVYNYLNAEGIEMEAKGIAVGVRLEHPAELIDAIQYHSREGRGKWLPAAEYNFVTQVESRGVYSFCMCPGGFVIPAATGPHQIVVNGMSPSNRGGKWSNSGMVVEVRADDVEGNDPMRIMHFQERLEQDCWQQGNMRQTAPAQRMADFVNGRLSYDLPKSSYSPGLISSPLHFWLPSLVATRLREGFRIFGRRSHGFLTNEAVAIAVETRTSAPLRITRSPETLMHIRLRGLFPAGEGAGYAGGIVSSAIDGERCAEKCRQWMEENKRT